MREHHYWGPPQVRDTAPKGMGGGGEGWRAGGEVAYRKPDWFWHRLLSPRRGGRFRTAPIITVIIQVTTLKTTCGIMHNQFKTQKFKHLMLAMGPRDLNSAPCSPVHCSSHSMTSFQSSELTEVPVVENSQLFAQRAHSACTAHGTPPGNDCSFCFHCTEQPAQTKSGLRWPPSIVPRNWSIHTMRNIRWGCNNLQAAKASPRVFGAYYILVQHLNRVASLR